MLWPLAVTPGVTHVGAYHCPSDDKFSYCIACSIQNIYVISLPGAVLSARLRRFQTNTVPSFSVLSGWERARWNRWDGGCQDWWPPAPCRTPFDTPPAFCLQPALPRQTNCAMGAFVHSPVFQNTRKGRPFESGTCSNIPQSTGHMGGFDSDAQGRTPDTEPPQRPQPANLWSSQSSSQNYTFLCTFLWPDRHNTISDNCIPLTFKS